ncbi:hypothetical protein [Marinobacter sp.]|uniref:Nmad3 family putative nucleotide modification protein n=1 Tax=Marinobacter sp. TaxID=50741 RepID=UPI0039766698
MLTVDELPPEVLPWARYHPHFRRGPDPGNTVYVASGHWRLSACRPALPGSGVFRRLEDCLMLTDPEARLPTRWRLPAGFFPSAGKPALCWKMSS